MADRGEDGELRTELRTLRARVEEQTALTKRTADALRKLADSLVSHKRGYEKLLSLNSFAAYLLFTLLLGGGFYLLYESRVGELVEAERAAAEARDSARERADALQDELDARRAASKRAREFYDLVQSGEAPRILSAYPELDAEALTPTERAAFAEAAEEARAEVAGERSDLGLEAYREGAYEEAVGSLERALELEEEGPEASTLRYYAGLSYYHLDEHEDAVRALELALAGGVEAEGMSDARYYFAAALEELGERARARAAYERFAAENPSSAHASDARQKADALAGD